MCKYKRTKAFRLHELVKNMQLFYYLLEEKTMLDNLALCKLEQHGVWYVLYDPTLALSRYKELFALKKQLLSANLLEDAIVSQVRLGLGMCVNKVYDIRTIARNPKYPGSGTLILKIASADLGGAYFTGDRDHSNNADARKMFASIERAGDFEKIELQNYAVLDDQKVFLNFDSSGAKAVVINRPENIDMSCFIGKKPNQEFLATKNKKQGSSIKFKTFGTPFAFKAKDNGGINIKQAELNHRKFLLGISAIQKQDDIESKIFIAADNFFMKNYNDA